MLNQCVIILSCFSAGGLAHLSNPGPPGPLLFNTCPEPCSRRTVLSSLCGEQLCVPDLLGFPMGMGKYVHVSHTYAQGSYCPLLVNMLFCAIRAPRTKCLGIDCSIIFILRLGGFVSCPKITLKSDYIQFLTPGTSIFFPLSSSQKL